MAPASGGTRAQDERCRRGCAYFPDGFLRHHLSGFTRSLRLPSSHLLWRHFCLRCQLGQTVAEHFTSTLAYVR